MGLNKKSVFLLQFSLLIAIIFLVGGCASIQKPMGGPRDRTPPKLLLATPLNQTRNFKATQIKLDFDEYFKLVSTYQEITVSPAMEKQPEYKVKGKSLVINFKDSLQKNTTYVINFGKGIADVNEGNVLKNFTYVFSTGPHIDSLSITGTVMNTQTQQKEKDATVMLFTPKQDSLLFGKKKPAIYATTDSSGNFSLNNLHDGIYNIYALKEAAPNKIYDHDEELIAFLKKPIHLNKDTSGVQLTLFKQASEKFRAEKKFNADGSIQLILNRPLTEPDIHINYPEGFNDQKLVEFNKTKDTAMLYMRNMDFDSLSMSITEKGKPLDTLSQIKRKKETYTRLVGISFNINNDGKLKPATDLMLSLNSPIESFDVSRIILLEDSVNRTDLTVDKDPLSSRKFILKYRWRQDKRYQLTFNEGTFTNIYGDKNKRQPKNFTIDKPENYGTIELTVTLPDSGKTYVVELLNEQKNVVHTDVIKKSGIINYKGFLAGKYQVRVTYDTNNNGRWDSGNVKRKLYPEQIILIPSVFSIRPNWEDKVPISIPKEVVTQ